MATRIFLASSSEGYDDLLRVAGWLENIGIETVKWRDEFPPGHYVLTRLLEIARKEVDGAICLLTPDDTVVTRGAKRSQPRDNLLLEYGIFAAVLGERCAVICEKGADLKIATDMLGITRIRLDASDKQLDSKAESELVKWAKQLPSRLSHTSESKSQGIHAREFRVALHCSETSEIKASLDSRRALKIFYRKFLEELFRLRVNINTCGSELFRDVIYEFYCDTFLKSGRETEYAERSSDWIRWYWHPGSHVIARAPLVFRSMMTPDEDARTWAEADDADLIVAVCGKTGTVKQVQKVLGRTASHKKNDEKPVIILSWFGGDLPKLLELKRPQNQESQIIRQYGGFDFASPRPDWSDHIPELATGLARTIWQILEDRKASIMRRTK